jgi:hypothetical protein
MEAFLRQKLAAEIARAESAVKSADRLAAAATTAQTRAKRLIRASEAIQQELQHGINARHVGAAGRPAAGPTASEAEPARSRRSRTRLDPLGSTALDQGGRRTTDPDGGDR